jgi:hypothetical protein
MQKACEPIYKLNSSRPISYAVVRIKFLSDPLPSFEFFKTFLLLRSLFLHHLFRAESSALKIFPNTMFLKPFLIP